MPPLDPHRAMICGPAPRGHQLPYARGPCETPRDLLRLPVLVNMAATGEWRDWLTAAGVSGGPAGTHPVHRFADRALVTAVMRRGLGFSIGCRNPLSADLASGPRDVDLHRDLRRWLPDATS